MSACSVEFIVIDLYNNAEDSDVKIELASGETIFAHKLILKRQSDMCRRLFDNKMLESKTGVIKFPEHPDNVVVALIQFLYGVEIYPSEMDFCNWYSLFEFANYLQVNALTNFLDTNCPVNPPLDELIDLAWTLDRPALMKTSVELFFEFYNNCEDIDDFNKLMDDVECINFDAYMQFRKSWIGCGSDYSILFELDCNYISKNCDSVAEKFEMINMMIPDIRFEKFCKVEIELCQNFQLLKDLPAIRHLISRIPGRSSSDWRGDEIIYTKRFSWHSRGLTSGKQVYFERARKKAIEDVFERI